MKTDRNIGDCPFACRRALLGLQPGIPFKDSPLIAGDLSTMLEMTEGE